MADRDATAAVITELGKSKNQPVHLIEVTVEDADGVATVSYMTDAWTNVVWNGHTYLALGHFLGFTDIEETADVQVNSLTLSLSGVDQAWISAFLSYFYIDRPVKIYKAFLADLYVNPWRLNDESDNGLDTEAGEDLVWEEDEEPYANMAIISDPVLIFEGRMDEPGIEENPEDGSCVVTVSATNIWVDFERKAGRHTNHEEQQIFFPGDLGFQYASEIVKDITWGRK